MLIICAYYNKFDYLKWYLIDFCFLVIILRNYQSKCIFFSFFLYLWDWLINLCNCQVVKLIFCHSYITHHNSIKMLKHWVFTWNLFTKCNYCSIYITIFIFYYFYFLYNIRLYIMCIDLLFFIFMLNLYYQF